ncbi:hypothetical protein [Cellulomonas bogoriensis]|nr:hypothetical protein [Cellulomonas bogoriensis]
MSAHPPRGRPDHHDPTSGWGGAPPAYSALTLRIVLAGFGVVLGAGLVAWALLTTAPVAFALLGVAVLLLALVNLVVVVRRKTRGEPG